MAAMTRRLSLSDGARPSLAKMLATCFSTTPGEMNSDEAMAVLERPSAMSASTSRSRPVCHVGQSDDAEHLVHPARPDAVGLRQAQQVTARVPAAVRRPRVEQRADLVHRASRPAVRPAVDRDRPGRRPVEAEDQPHRRALPGPVGTEEPGHHTGSYREVEVVDRKP
jgi:hypothetical protein